MRTLAILLGLVAAVHAAPAPYPVTINSRSATAPNLSAYRSGQQVYRVTFTDGSTASDISGATAFMGWSTNATAATTSTATVSVVGATTGLVDFTFSPAALNYAPGRYIYEVGVLNASVPSVYRRGTFIIEGSPYSAGAAPITWTTNVNLGTINWIGTMPKANLPTDIVYGVIAAGTTNAAPSTSTNGSGIVTVNVPTNYAAGGCITASTATGIAEIVVAPYTNGATLGATAYGWGNHGAAGYATGTPVYAESDPNSLHVNGDNSMEAALDLDENDLANGADANFSGVVDIDWDMGEITLGNDGAYRVARFASPSDSMPRLSLLMDTAYSMYIEQAAGRNIATHPDDDSDLVINTLANDVSIIVNNNEGYYVYIGDGADYSTKGDSALAAGDGTSWAVLCDGTYAGRFEGDVSIGGDLNMGSNTIANAGFIVDPTFAYSIDMLSGTLTGPNGSGDGLTIVGSTQLDPDGGVIDILAGGDVSICSPVSMNAEMDFNNTDRIINAVVTNSTYYGNGAGLTNLPSSGGGGGESFSGTFTSNQTTLGVYDFAHGMSVSNGIAQVYRPEGSMRKLIYPDDVFFVGALSGRVDVSTWYDAGTFTDTWTIVISGIE